jgi:hypothetical protein
MCVHTTYEILHRMFNYQCDDWTHVFTYVSVCFLNTQYPLLTTSYSVTTTGSPNATVRYYSEINFRLGVGRTRNSGLIPDMGEKYFPSPKLPDQNCGLPRLLLSGYGGLFPRGKSGWGVKLTTYIHLMRGLRMSKTVFPLQHTPPLRAPRYLFFQKLIFWEENYFDPFFARFIDLVTKTWRARCFSR